MRFKMGTGLSDRQIAKIAVARPTVADYLAERVPLG